MPEWLAHNIPDGWSETQFIIVVVVFSVGTAIISILASAVAVVRIPPNYFVGAHPPRLWADRHPLIRWPLLIGKNLLGLLLVALGVVMSLPGVPGQGLLTILIGAMLVNFPGKRACERWLLQRRGVLPTINKLRAKAGRAPLQLATPTANP
jgi:hypothetical protein